MDKVRLPTELTGTEFLLRQHHISDAPALFTIVDAERSRLRQFLAWVDDVNTESDIETSIRHSHECRETCESFRYLIVDQVQNRPLGTISVVNISWTDSRCEIGYWLCSSAEGRGIVSNALQRLEGLLFSIGFHRIEIHCRGMNARSIAVALRNGYQCEGILRDAEFDHGEFIDMHVFAKLSSR